MKLGGVDKSHWHRCPEPAMRPCGRREAGTRHERVIEGPCAVARYRFDADAAEKKDRAASKAIKAALKEDPGTVMLPVQRASHTTWSSCA